MKKVASFIAGLFICTMAVLLFLPGDVHAEEKERDFIVTGTASYFYDGGLLTITGGDAIIKNRDPDKPTTDRIVITGSGNITLDGVNIARDGTGKGNAPISIIEKNPDTAERTHVALILADGKINTLECKYKGLEAAPAALRVDYAKDKFERDKISLTIKGTGTLNATSDTTGIGATTGAQNASPITVESGNINVWAGNQGIFGSQVTINGGAVAVKDTGKQATWDQGQRSHRQWRQR